MLAPALMGWGRDVKTVRVAGPFRLHQPVVVDSVDAAQKKFSKDALFNTRTSFSTLKEGKIIAVDSLNADTTLRGAVLLAGFDFDVDAYARVEVKARGPKQIKVYINNEEAYGRKPFVRGHYDVVVKYLCDTAALRLSVSADSTAVLTVDEPQAGEARKHPFTMADNMEMKHYGGLQVSPGGKYALYNVFWYNHNGTYRSENRLVETATGRLLMEPRGGLRWMPRSELLLENKESEGKHRLVAVNPADLSERVLCEDMPDGGYRLSPTEDFAILTGNVSGPQREKDVYEILTPDDRQPGWRNRSNLSLLDLKTGVVQPLTFGYRNQWLNDISQDGRYILFTVRDELLSPLGAGDSVKETDNPPRPTEVSTVLRMDVKTLSLDTLILRDGFIDNVMFLPGTDKLIIRGSAEALGGVGNILPAGVIPSTYDYQLFLLDIPTRKVTPLTRDFTPSVSAVKPAPNGEAVFFTANNEDSVSLYRLNIKDLKITRIDQPLEVVEGFDLSRDGRTLMYYGSSTCSPEALYCFAPKTGKPCVMDEANADRMQTVEIGTCHSLRFQSARGYTLTGYYYLPPHFDSGKKYPVIVHYYGGCTPTSRRFGNGSHYPSHYWNAMGYVVLICNPSGASGFGAEWASRHVNTMGEGVAEDIIETVRHFARNPWVDSTKIGCISASYGGFMTQLLLTKTNLFAAGVSHAGISSHTSYWGEGYWGYTYSQTCAANSYPWTRKDLFVDRSPLYNAEKIHTPLLFTHGTADTNVPIGESIQMYTALKLLGRPTAFVMVEGENHGIMDFHKRQKWINTIVAWFDRWLKGQPAWWNAIYKPKEL